MQCCPCLLHLNELPIQHLLVFLDGKTQGSNKLTTGPIGKMMANIKEVEKKPIVNFKAVPSAAAKTDANFFNGDQGKTLQWSQGIDNSEYNEILDSDNVCSHLNDLKRFKDCS